MVATLVDPRIALCDKRTILLSAISRQRAAFKATCGCGRCGDAVWREQLARAIHNNLLELDDLTDLITDHACLPAH